MNSIKSFKKVYNIANVITIAVVLLLLLCFAFSFDTDNGYLNKTPLSFLFMVTYLAGIIISVLTIFIPSEFEVLKSSNTIEGMAKSYYTAACIACILFGGLGTFLTNDVLDSHTTMVAGLGLMFFGIFILLMLVMDGYTFKFPKLIFLFLSISLPVILSLGNTKNYVHHINSTENILCVFFSISFLLYILNEARRICLGYHSNWHFASMLLTYITGLSLSGSYVIAFIFNSVKEGYRFYQMLIILIVSIFMGIELKHFLYTVEPQSKIKWSVNKEQ